MYFRQILHEDLGCASYIFADGGEAVVVDPKWEIEDYLRAAEEAGAAIRHVVETHTHADHVSGRARLGAATGATVHVPADPSVPDAGGIRDGEEIRIGDVTLRAVAAPGHRPEHLAYLLVNATRSPLLLSGDSLFVGDVARPDLAVAAEAGARALFDTLHRFDALGDEVELWPAHVGGSLCGSGSLSAETSSTLGLERRRNPLLSLPTREEFVAELTRSIPPRPPTVERVVELNRDAAGAPPRPRELDAEALADFVARGCVVDIRAPQEFDAGHIAGAINLPAALKGLGTRAGWAIGPDEPLALVAQTHDGARAVASLLHAAGLWNVEGITLADPERWSAAGLDVDFASALEPEAVVPRLAAGELRLLDVRDRDEWLDGHVEPSLHVPPGVLGSGDGLSLPASEPLAVACAAGNRAALSASVLRRHGYANVVRVLGGVQDLPSHGATWVNGG